MQIKILFLYKKLIYNLIKNKKIKKLNISKTFFKKSFKKKLIS